MQGLIFDVDGVMADIERVNAADSIKVFSDLFGADEQVVSATEALQSVFW